MYSLVTVFLFTGGYLLFHLEERYLWLVNVLLLIMGGYVLTIFFQKKYFENNFRKSILIVFFIISFIFTPVKFVIQVGRGGMDPDMYYLSTDLKHTTSKGI